MLVKSHIQVYMNALILCLSTLLKYSICNTYIERYSHPGVTYYQQLLFDVNSYQLIVGARDYLLRLRLEKFNDWRVEDHYIPADSEKQKLCQRKGMKSWQCHNYITVLLPITAHKQILICGTNAFSPECEIRQLSSLSIVLKRESAISKSAFSPLWNTSSLVSQSGDDYYYAGPLDFRGIDAAIVRHSNSPLSTASSVTTMAPMNNSSYKKPILRTIQSDSKWINADANFVFSFEYEKHIYFLFRESAVEFINCGKSIFSRIGRVCKNDNGGQFYFKENWTSFIKSRLNCSIPGLFPFYFDQIQSVEWLESNDVPTIYATFSTPDNSIHGSAVCAFRIDSVLSSFHGNFKHQKNMNSVWESAYVNKDVFECVASPVNGSHFNQFQRLNSQFQLMDSAVQSVNGRPYIIETEKRFKFIAVDVIQSQFHNSVEVIFVTTVDGILLKYVRWPFSTDACLVDQIKVVSDDDNHDSILTMKLLRDTQSLYLGTKSQIIRISVQRCNRFKNQNDCLSSGDPYCGWDQIKMSCSTAPGRNPYATNWIQSNSTSCAKRSNYEWSQWFECNHLNNSYGDRCVCRVRSCTGLTFEGCVDGKQIEVTNCTRNGVWSEWSQWSECSSSCGSANKTRYRKCSSPAFGGRNCRGPDRDISQCTNNGPCVDSNLLLTESKQLLSEWSQWSQWEECSSKCGGGVQLRRRRCDYQTSGQQCIGCDVEWRLCNRHECQEVKQQSEWTDWLIRNITGDGLVEQRVRFTCRAFLAKSETHNVNIQSRVEERFVSSHSSWSECSDLNCNGFQYKWNGYQYFRRECSRMDCNGWSHWSQWSDCVVGKQTRSRECDGTNRCSGHYKELRYCVPNGQNYEINSIQSKPVFRSSTSSDMSDKTDNNYSLEKVIVFSLLSFTAGVVLSGLLLYIYFTKTDRIRHMRHQRLSLRLFSSLKSNSNAYESPQEYKANQSAITPLNSISPVREATIKRSSTIRAKLHSDQNF